MNRTKVIGGERYGLALLLILASMVFIMAAPDGVWGRVVTLILQGSALVASLRAAQVSDTLSIAATAITFAAIVFAIGQAAVGENVSPLFVRATSFALVMLATPVIGFGIARQLKKERRVTVHTMMGVLCIYLLMSLVFAAAFCLIQEIDGRPFFREGPSADSLSNYLYFSLTTITTAGLGDFAPADRLGRSLTGAEALIGQIYLVTVVAVIVGNLGFRRSGHSDTTGDRP